MSTDGSDDLKFGRFLNRGSACMSSTDFGWRQKNWGTFAVSRDDMAMRGVVVVVMFLSSGWFFLLRC